MNLKNKIFTSIAVTLFFVSTALIFAPSQIFLSNVREFNVLYFELLGLSALVALPFFSLIALIIVLLPQNPGIHQKVVTLLLSLSFLLWLQGNILVWRYGLLTGQQISFNIYFLIFDAVVWLAIIITALVKSAFFYKYAKIVSGIIIFVQLLSTSYLVFNQPEIPTTVYYELDSTNKFTFSKENNVIVLVLDTFQSDKFQKIIDEDESYEDIFDGFTYYRNALAGFPTTYASIPNILTGQYYDNSVWFTEYLEEAFFSSNSIPSVLTDAGYEVDCFSPQIYLDKTIFSNIKDRVEIDSSTIVNIYDAAFFRYVPDFVKKYVYNDGKWFLKNSFLGKMGVLNSEDDERTPTNVPQVTFDEKALTLDDVTFINDMLTYSNTVGGINIFKFYRLDGCHAPYLLNENLKYEEMNDIDSYERQAKASLKITGLFLDELKRLEVFDNSMIFVIADHGIFGEFGGDMYGNACPLFLVKNFNGKGQMTFSDAPVSLSDIPKTIFSELGLKGDFDGESIFNLKESDYRERRFMFYNWATPGFLDFHSNYLPSMKEYIVSGFVWSSESWRFTGQQLIAEFGERPLLEWEDGFCVFLESTAEYNFRWCAPEGTLVINNTSDKARKFVMSADFRTGYPEMSNLKIESIFFNENLKINNAGYSFKKELVIPPGSHTIKFSCDAKRVEAPTDPRYLVFTVVNFQIVESE